MEVSAARARLSWWLALVAVALAGPWPGWSPSSLALGSTVVLLLLLARPRGRDWWPWLAVVLALAPVVVRPDPEVRPETLAQELDAHCEEMLRVADRVAGDRALLRFFAASGEALKPELPFTILRHQVGGGHGRTLFLADDRAGVVAWAGEQRAYPSAVRPLGPRLWGVAWSARGAALYLREPVLVDGRLVGAVTVADHAPLSAARIWSMQAPVGCELVIGQGRGRQLVRAGARPTVEVPIGCQTAPPLRRVQLEWLSWLSLAAVALFVAPAVAVAALVTGSFALAFAPGEAPPAVLMALLLLGGAAVGRIAGRLRRPWARVLIGATLLAAGAASLLGPRSPELPWLPTHLLQPGWGGVWMTALGLVVAAWSGRERLVNPSLGRLLAAATVLAGIAAAVELVRLPTTLLAQAPGRSGTPAHGVVLPRGELRLDELLPAPPSACHVADLAPHLAEEWGLDRWQTPAALTLTDGEGTELSRWGDLDAAQDAVRRMRTWRVGEHGDWALDLEVAVEPWSWLADWRPGRPRDEVAQSATWFAVLTRSGSVAATLHPELPALDPVTAGGLFHAGEGWALVRVGDSSQLARVRREGEWLVAAIARTPAPSVWVVQMALACLWALVGLSLARPPVMRRQQLATFGGRLRLLVAAGVVLPLVILTLFLHLRLRREERRVDQVAGLSALRSARYAAVSLAEGLTVDDQLASWLARLAGGEVVLFDGHQVVAVSRRDLLATDVLPELPLAAVFPPFLLGRDDAVVMRQEGRLVAAGAVEIQGRRLLLQVLPAAVAETGAAPEAVDWLLTGAILAALVVLVLTSRVERRLSTSLRDLVSLAGRLLDGEPVGAIRRPKETDLAEVLDAVRSMNEQVQQRELSLRHQEELLRITLATLVPAVMVLEGDGETVRFANPSAERLLARHRDRVLDRVRQMASQTGSPAGAVVETVQPVPGEELTWRVGVAGVPLPDGSRGLVAVVDDVTDVVRVDRLRQLTQLARIVAHEVKNPLTPVRLWVQELEEARRRGDPQLEELLAEACREISTQVERLQATASSFSNLVALERWEPVPVDLVELVEETLSGLAVLGRRGITVSRELPAPGTCVVIGDRGWMRRALDNLVKNSVDALAGSLGEVALRVTCGGDAVVVEVEDSGGGVPEARLEDLFSPHFSTTTGGSGLGLALVGQVVGKCQGRVAAHNGPCGLVVRLELPRASEGPRKQA